MIFGGNYQAKGEVQNTVRLVFEQSKKTAIKKASNLWVIPTTTPIFKKLRENRQPILPNISRISGYFL